MCMPCFACVSYNKDLWLVTQGSLLVLVVSVLVGASGGLVRAEFVPFGPTGSLVLYTETIKHQPPSP